MTDGLTITEMALADLQTALHWAGSEGWNPGAADAAAFLSADPKGFFMARVNADPVAAISVVNHDDSNAFLGLYICRPEWRGRGFGWATWTHALKHAESRSVGLDGVPDQQENYRKSGFVRTGQTLRFVGRVPPARSSELRDAGASDGHHLIALDAKANGYTRSKFITAWISPVAGLRASRVLVHEGEIIGFATWRECQEGTKIGPLIAPSTGATLALISDIAALRPDGPLIIDLPEANLALRRELEGAGFDVPFVTARMYRGRVPEQDGCLQAIATMELG